MSGLFIIGNWFLEVTLPHERGEIKTLKVIDGALSFKEEELSRAYLKPNLVEKHFWFDVYEWSQELEDFCLQHNVGIY